METINATLIIGNQRFSVNLAADQVNQITKKKNWTYTDIDSVEKALEYLGESKESFKKRTQFDDDGQLESIFVHDCGELSRPDLLVFGNSSRFSFIQ